MIAPTFTDRKRFYSDYEVWPGANRAVVTNNSTVIIKVVLIEAVLIEGFLYYDYIDKPSLKFQVPDSKHCYG